ncbi:MAG: PD40 domain-containing protein [Proteobacteria bacterium]|nr:PD40 domain-containing protein [Pseudomonadota bacterium]
MLSHIKLDGSNYFRANIVALIAAAFAIAACDGANQGVQIGNGQAPDPVIVDFPIAYIKAPLPVDDQGEFAQTDARELISFDFGADLYFKDRASPSSLAVNITGEITQGLGAIRDVEIAYDGSAVVFAMRTPVDLNLAIDDENQPTWNIWEYAFDTQTLRRLILSGLIAEIGHDIGPHYLPDGRIMFSSTRQLRSNAVLLDEGKPQFEAFDEDNNEPAFLLHVMNTDGSSIEQVTFNQSHEMDPSVLSNGQIVFSRWDHAGPNNAINLYRMNPDGSNLELLYGQNSHDTGTNGEIIQFLQPRELEDGRIMVLVRPFTDTSGGGDIIIIDTPVYLENTQPTKDNAGMTGPAQESATIVNVTTQAGVPSPGGRYSSAYPIQDGTGRLLTSWSQCRLTDILDPNDPPPLTIINYPCTPENLANPLYEEADPTYGIWIYDPRDGTQQPIVIAEAGFTFTEVISADPRPTPPVILDSINVFADDPDLAIEGAAMLKIRSVYDFDGGAVVDIDSLANPALTTSADMRPARFLRIVKAVSIPDDNFLDIDRTAFGPSRALGMKEIVGYAMVEPDGSVMMKVPANTALSISVLDGNGRRITARHHNWIQLRPGQLLECNGCHIGQSGVSHGRYAAFETAYAGAANIGEFNSGTVDALFVGTIGETMAEVRARMSCAAGTCSSLEPSMDVEFTDVWTDEIKAGRPADPSFTYAYTDLTTPPPTTVNCITQAWNSSCRIVVNYEMHIHPLWGTDRPVLDPITQLPVLDPLTGLPLTNNCTNCHTIVDDAGAARIPDGQLDLTDGLSVDEPDQFKSYRELLFTDLEQTVDANGNLVDFMEVIGVDVDGNDILAPVNVSPSMSAGGANASIRFFSRFDNAGDMHSGFMSDAEKRLIAEWLDVGAQYYNNPFDAPAN